METENSEQTYTVLRGAMPSKVIYKPVTEGDVVFTVEGDDSNGDSLENETTTIENLQLQPMEISEHSFDDDFSENLFNWKDPWFPSMLVTLCLIIPIGLASFTFFVHLLSTWFVGLLILLHLLLILWTARHMAGCKRLSQIESPFSRILTSVVCLVDVLGFGVLYPFILRTIDTAFFIEDDDTVSNDWVLHHRFLVLARTISILVAVFRGVLGINAIGLRAAVASMDSSFADQPTFVDKYCNCPSWVLAPFLYLENRLQKYSGKVVPSSKRRIRQSLRRVLDALILITTILLLICLRSAWYQLLPAQAPVQDFSGCDPLDETECWLPFPSFHFLKPDSSSDTGYRVNLEAKILPPLKNRRLVEPGFLNRLDGFSTLAPILFYLDGLKEAHEAGLHQLQGAEYLAKSVTNSSITLLLDVSEAKLLPHTAQIDYLDEKHPIVMVFPSTPLHHNHHYAVAVVNAKDKIGRRLRPTPGMAALLKKEDGSERRDRYVNVLLPALSKAASWLDLSKDQHALQLMFDFHTASELSQLGPIRAVRDGALKRMSSDWDWKRHVRVTRQDDYDCRKGGTVTARTIHAEMDVPWFLESTSRFSLVSQHAVASGRPTGLGTSKFMVHVPCSLKRAALGESVNALHGAKPLRAVLEYGHGLFGSRAESLDDYLQNLAHDQGYVVVATDWRGMSRYDLLVVVTVLVARPHLFEAVRDNLIQGYACKFALQLFARHALLESDWLKFDGIGSDGMSSTPMAVPTLNDDPPQYVYYGVSQGGILGAGYTALSGSTGLIDRSVLTSAGTTFSLIMTRSRDFLVYDKLLLLNFYDNRHVRSFLTLAQMAWDSVEASGLLAPPVKEPVPRVIIQAGLGDAIVSSISSEALARAYNASSLPASPREIFGVRTEAAASKESVGPYATLSELSYDRQFESMPEDNLFAKENDIHWCTRMDFAMIAQLAEFVNTGRVIDPCISDGCHRNSARC